MSEINKNREVHGTARVKGKNVYIKTMGCQMNTRDSEVIAGLLQKAGYKIIDDEAAADIVIFNTCSVRQHAEDKVWSEIGRVSKVKKGKSTLARSKCELGINARVMPNSKPIIGLVGCMAQNYKEAAFERSADVDFVVGPADIAKIPGIIKEIDKYKNSLLEKKIYETDGLTREDEIYHSGFHSDKKHAYVVIAEGCENYCSYCIVPYVRGKLRFRSDTDILAEIKENIAAGISKITLLGQNVNAYQHREINFIKLLELVNSIKGVEEFSFVTSHPKDAPVELFKAIQELEKLKKYLHLPIQSGSDRMLKLMNRNYTAKSYVALARDYRKIVKNGVLTTDIIVGFPTETENDFQETFDLVKNIGFNAAFIFKYSPRPHTEAAEWPDDVVKEEKERRHRLILELQKKISKLKKC